MKKVPKPDSMKVSLPEPIYDGARLRVVHVRDNFHRRPEQDILFLGPGPGFGSGGHPTTCMCLSVLERLMEKYIPTKVLDAGTGSGILAIAAARLGAESVFGVEIERESVETARRNLLLNQVQDLVSIYHGDIQHLSGRYDLILANLSPGQVPRLGEVLVERLSAGGYFIISGLAGFAVHRTLRRLTAKRGLTLLEKCWDQGWTTLCLHYSR